MEARTEVLARRRLTTRWHRYARAHTVGHAQWPRTVQPLTAALLALGVGLAALAMHQWSEDVPFSVFLPFAVLAGLLLTTKNLLVVDTILLACAAWAVLALPGETRSLYLWAFAILTGVILIMFWVASSRARLGVQGTLGETMLVDLRDRLRSQGELPRLPSGWGAESSVLSAYGGSFSGDFVVTAQAGDTLEVVLVDVSGKGVAAGTRSLLLSGAFGGLLGSMPVDGFLPAANLYLLRQHWDEGFATAAHVVIDLRTGEYTIGSAGHPPAVRFSAGSGRWEILDGAEGPALGVTERFAFPRATGVLGRGDALLFYTDGLIETRTRNLPDGIDRMLGTAEKMIRDGFEGMAARLCTEARAGEADDRAAVVVWRR